MYTWSCTRSTYFSDSTAMCTPPTAGTSSRMRTGGVVLYGLPVRHEVYVHLELYVHHRLYVHLGLHSQHGLHVQHAMHVHPEVNEQRRLCLCLCTFILKSKTPQAPLGVCIVSRGVQTLREVRLPAAMRTSTFPRTRSRHADNDGGRSLGRLSPGHEATNTEMRLRPNNKTRKKPYIPVYMQMQSEREHAAPPQLLYTLIQHISIYMYIYIYMLSIICTIARWGANSI